MKVVLALLVLASAICWWSAITGIETYSTGTRGTHITYRPDLLSRALAGVYGALLLGFAVAVYRKLKYAWHVGLLGIAALWATFIFNTSMGVLQAVRPPPTMFVVVALGVATLVHFLLGFWWYRKRGYFGAHDG